MSETLLGVVIGGAFGVLGTLLGFVANLWLEGQKARRQHLQEVRQRLVGEHIQTSDALEFIRLQRKRKWPQFWKREPPDLSQANLQNADLSKLDLRGASLFHTNLTRADLSFADLREANLAWASLEGTNLEGANLEEANLTGANLTRANLKGANLSKADTTGTMMTSIKCDDDTRLP
jgi:uncharacterized protein YjbI with pentapeptide repeats